MASCALASVWNYCATVPRDDKAQRDQLGRTRMCSEEVMEMRRKRLNPLVQPVEMNTLYNRRRGSRDAHVEYVVLDLTNFSDLEEKTVCSPLTSTTAGSSPPRTLERQYAL